MRIENYTIICRKTSRGLDSQKKKTRATLNNVLGVFHHTAQSMNYIYKSILKNSKLHVEIYIVHRVKQKSCNS